jgi:hypothetical protein
VDSYIAVFIDEDSNIHEKFLDDCKEHENHKSFHVENNGLFDDTPNILN